MPFHFPKLTAAPRKVVVFLLLLLCLTGVVLSSNLNSYTLIPDIHLLLSQTPGAVFKHSTETPQTNIAEFIHKLTQKPDAVRNTATSCIIVPLQPKAVYLLQYYTTYQAVATTDSSLMTTLIKQLDAQYISYDVFKNTGEYILLQQGEWIVCWGGILYLPHFKPSLQTH
jgi:hypothetical protein